MGEEEPAPFWSRKCLPIAADVGRPDRVNAVLELTKTTSAKTHKATTLGGHTGLP